MKESTKTLAFLAIGAVALVAAYFIDRPTQAVNVQTLVGRTLNDDFEVDAPKRLKIIKFDPDTATTRQFEVAALEDGWSIPSKQDYPADATEQMASAANALINRKILRIAAQTAEDHPEYGVVDPQSSKLDSKSKGVGTRVVMTDGNDKQLVDMIIGKRVKDAEGQRYVRKSNQDVVYVVELDATSLSTDFNDWIEDDLLKLSPFDIRRVQINDYSAELGLTRTPDGGMAPTANWNRRGEYTLTYDNTDAKWNLASIKKYDRAERKLVDDKLAEDEELNQDKLGELRNGLDELLIVDVAKKPDGLSADLKGGKDFLNNEEAAQDLMSKGFLPVPMKEGGELDLLSSEGEVICTLRDGVEYVLRFGQLKVQTDSAAEGREAGAEAEAAAAAAAAAGSDQEGKNLRRYLFVMARFNEDIIDKPALKELPPLPAGAEPPADEAAEPAAAPVDGDPAGGEPAEAPAEGEPAADAAPPTAAGGDEPAAADKAEATDETNPEDAKDEAAEAGEPAADEANKEPTEAEKIAAERKAVETENQRLEDEYKQTVEGGKKNVAELNERFGDWYYVISNDVYKQIHLGRDQIIKKKDKPAADAAAEGAAAAGANPLPGLPNLPLDQPAEPAAEPAEPAEDADQPAPTEGAEEPAPAAEAPAEG